MCRNIKMLFNFEPPATEHAAARSDPPTLTWVTTTAVSTAHSPCSGMARSCVSPNASKAATVIRRQKRNWAR